VIELPEVSSRKPFTEEIRALTAIPVKMIFPVEMEFKDLAANPFEILKIIIVVAIANKNATGVMIISGSENGSMKMRIAPSPAPAEIPSRPGSARLLRSIDCKIIPEHESEAPTIIAFKTLGSLMSSRIFLFVSLPAEKIFTISFNGIETLPIDSEIMKDIISSTNKPRRIKTLLDNN